MSQKYEKEYKIWHYYILGGIFIMALILTYFDKDGVGIGCLGLVSWCIIFSKIRRIKFGDYGIDFLTKKDLIDEFQRKQLFNNYRKVEQFINLFWERGCICKDALNLISDAYLDGKLFLPDDLLKEIEKYAECARKSFVLEKKHGWIKEEDELAELNRQITKLNSIFYHVDVSALYRKYLSIDELR